MEGHDPVPVRGGDKAKDVLLSDYFDLMITDIRMDPVDGMELLKIAHRERPGMAVIMLTAYGSVETAVEAMKAGAFDYVTKPFKVDELLDHGAALADTPDSQRKRGSAQAARHPLRI